MIALLTENFLYAVADFAGSRVFEGLAEQPGLRDGDPAVVDAVDDEQRGVEVVDGVMGDRSSYRSGSFSDTQSSPQLCSAVRHRVLVLVFEVCETDPGDAGVVQVRVLDRCQYAE